MRKLSKNKTASPIKMPKGSKPTNLRKRTKGFSFKPKSKSKDIRRKKQRTSLNPKYLIIVLVIISFGGLIFISAKYILSLRQNAFGEKTFIINDVVGLNEVPQYPGSEFIFENSKEQPTVKAFLAEGNSAYRLPTNTSVEELEAYYQEKLPEKGWELVNSVVIGTEDKKYGQYWIKNGKGLRIYLKFKDAWYETLTEKDAREALAQRVKEEIVREMLMASSEKQDLLPDYPWVIQIPKEYIIRYSPTDISDYREASFQKLGTNDIVTMTPAGYWGAKELDFILEDYCKSISDQEVNWEVQNTVAISHRGNGALRGIITSEKGLRNVLVIPNSYNNIVYVLSTEKENDPIFEYIFENVKPLGSD